MYPSALFPSLASFFSIPQPQPLLYKTNDSLMTYTSLHQNFSVRRGKSFPVPKSSSLESTAMATADTQFHVLAVDDSLIDRKLIERLLKTSSFKVTAVDSGIKALEFLVSPRNHQELEVNLVITDYCMPGMTGYDLLKKIKESSFLRDIPVVIMSSENVPSRINRCLEEGAEEFLLKPVRLSDVNKLRPHIMKSKQREYQNHSPESQESGEEFHDHSPENLENGESKKVEEGKEDSRSNFNNNKRKAVDDGQPPERTARPRYSDLTVMSN